jgi:hypothetical protein
MPLTDPADGLDQAANLRALGRHDHARFAADLRSATRTFTGADGLCQPDDHARS